jgi:hypothetical protein
MATVTVTTAAEAVAVWEQEQVAPCVRCCYPTTTAPVAKGVVVAGGILCDDCRFHLIHIGEWGDFLARLCPTRPEGADDGDDDPDGGPAAPAPARPTSTGRTGPTWPACGSTCSSSCRPPGSDRLR